MEWVVFRPPLLYAPGVRGKFLSLLKIVFHGISLPLGSLHNSRGLISVFNLSDCLSLLLDHSDAANNRFLVTDEHDISTPNLVCRIALALHCLSRIIRCPEAVLHMAGSVLRRR